MNHRLASRRTEKNQTEAENFNYQILISVPSVTRNVFLGISLKPLESRQEFFDVDLVM